MEKKDGGPAFPHMMAVGHRDYAGGLTLRDWFAGQALCGILQNLHVQGSFDHGVSRNAEAAYALADAMIEAREPPPPGPHD